MPALLPSASQTHRAKQQKQKPLNYLIYQQHQLYHPIHFNNRAKHASPVGQTAHDSLSAAGSSSSDSDQETILNLLRPSDPDPHLSSNTTTLPSQPQVNLIDLKAEEEEEVDQLESDGSDALEEEEDEGQGPTQTDGIHDGPEETHGREEPGPGAGMDGAMNTMMMETPADDQDGASRSHPDDDDDDDPQLVKHEPTTLYTAHPPEWDSQQASMLLSQLEQGRFFVHCLPH